jgi:hypothetical protein
MKEALVRQRTASRRPDAFSSPDISLQHSDVAPRPCLKRRRHAIGIVRAYGFRVIILCTALSSVFYVQNNQPDAFGSRMLLRRLSYAALPIPSKPNTTLALLNPPGLMGGYRNQVIRLMGLVSYAAAHDYPYLYLPSVLWRTQMQQYPRNPWYPIPMELIFDVDYWNSDDFAGVLPKLVQEIDNSDCWTTTDVLPELDNLTATLHPLQQASLQQGWLRPIANATQASIMDPFLQLRKADYLSPVKHCQHPVVYGGGTGAGVLWNDYLGYRNNQTSNGRLPNDVDQHILRAIRPAPKWRALAESCLSTSVHTRDVSSVSYLALHARVELEMMTHNCGADMNWNLTDIFQQVTDYLRSNHTTDDSIHGVFVAVSRDGLQANISDGPYQKFRPFVEENLATLDRHVGNGIMKGEGLMNSRVSVFECGKRMMDRYYAIDPQSIYYGSLLEQVINFYIAVNAKVFVGVQRSSYSTDVWTTRYYMGRGSTNLQYTRNGRLEVVGNGGLPSPHKNCIPRKPAATGIAGAK